MELSSEFPNISNSDNSLRVGFWEVPNNSASSVPDKLLVFKVIIVASYNAAGVRGMGLGQAKSHKAYCSYQESVSFLINSPQIVANF